MSSSSCLCFFFFSSRRRHTRFDCDWSSDVCSSDLGNARSFYVLLGLVRGGMGNTARTSLCALSTRLLPSNLPTGSLSAHDGCLCEDRKSTRLNSSHSQISYAVFCLKIKILSSNHTL